MCVVTVVNRNENTKKKYFVEGSRASVSAAIQQTIGSFDDIYVEDLIRKDLHSFLGMLMTEKMQKTNHSPVLPQRIPKRFPEFSQFKG